MHSGILKDLNRAWLSGIALAVVLACAAVTPAGAQDAPGKNAADATQQKAQEDKTSIVSISVVGDGDRVLITSTGPVKYTVFKLSDPARLVVDMPGIALDKVTSPIRVDNIFLNDIAAVSYGADKEIGRIIIGLKEGVEHEVKSGENSILVSLRKESQAEAKPAAEAAPSKEPAKEAAKEAAKEEPQPKQQAIAEASGAAPAAGQDNKEKAAVTETAKQASRIIKLDVSHDAGNTIVTIEGDAAIGNYNSFELDSPSRVIIDVWGVANSTGQDSVTVNNKYVKDVRIGGHEDKVRLVVDMTGKTIAPYLIKKSDSTLVLTVGESARAEKAAEKPKTAKKAKERKMLAKADKKPDKAAAVSAPAPDAASNPAKEAPAAKEKLAANETPAVNEAPAPKEAPAAEAAKTVEVARVDYKKVNGKGRLTVFGTDKLTYTAKESEDGKTIVLDIKDATIREDLVRTLDATKLDTPVLTISSYQESLQPRDVRILVKLNEKTPYEVKEEDGSLVMDFPIAAQAAADMTAPQTPGPKPASEAEVKQYAGKRIDLDMVDANVTDILRLLAEVSNLNIIASDDVKGTISIRLKNVPWDQAFDIVLKSKDLDKIREGNVIRVAPAAKIRQEKEASLAGKKAQEKLEALEVRFVPVNYAKASDLEKQVKDVLTERGSVTSEARTNTLIVKDIKQGVEAAENLVKRLDTVIPQVLIEARIVEASTSFARDLGIQWGVDYQTGGHVTTNLFGSTTTVGQVPPKFTSTQTSPTLQTAATGIGAKDFAVNLPAAGSAGPLGALGFVFGKAGPNPLLLDLRLSAGEQEGRVRTISRPRITTMDNKEAKIEQGESIPFSTTSASGTATTFIDANLSLTVTPHITPDGSVLMKIKASRNSIGTFRTSSGEPSINKKESSTEVLVKDGETTVIGGIVISDKHETDTGIPFLKDIPLLGWLFKNKSVSDSQTELLIFITPTIMKDKVVGQNSGRYHLVMG